MPARGHRPARRIVGSGARSGRGIRPSRCGAIASPMTAQTTYKLTTSGTCDVASAAPMAIHSDAHHPARAIAVDPSPDLRGGERHHEQAHRERAGDDRACRVEILEHRDQQDGEPVVDHPPVDALACAEQPDRAPQRRCHRACAPRTAPHRHGAASIKFMSAASMTSLRSPRWPPRWRDVRPRIRDEAIAVGHLHPRQRCLGQAQVRRDDVIRVQEECGERVDLIRR
jgi:hypothetical protein